MRIMIYISKSSPLSDFFGGRDEDLTTYGLQGCMISEMNISALVKAMCAESLVD